MKKLRICFIFVIYVLVFDGYATLQPNVFNALTETGNFSNVTLAYVKKQNYVQPNGRGGFKVNYPGGLVFYFIIEPKNKEFGMPIIYEKQDFMINGKEYNRFKDVKGYQTQEDGTKKSVSINPEITIYSKNSLLEKEPKIARIFVSRGIIDATVDAAGDDIFIQKNIICGEKLPEEGVIDYIFSFGYLVDGNEKTEDFAFRFELENIE